MLLSGRMPGIIGIFLLLLLVGWLLIPSSWIRDQGTERAELRRFVGGLTLGMSSRDVVDRFESGKYQGFELMKQPRGQWWAKTPFRLGAKNWLVVLEFADERLSCIRFRTEDTLAVAPVDAPADHCR